MIYEQELRAPDLAEIAELTAPKVRRFAAPTPPVMTPFLLTAQLKKGLGVCCADCGGMAGGMIPPDYGTLRQYEFAEGMGVYSCPPTYNRSMLGVPSAGSGNISVLQTIAAGAQFIPGYGTLAATAIQVGSQMVNQFETWLGIGAGRREADIIVPVQNQMMAHLGTITNQILSGASVNAATLAGMYRDVWATAVAFQEFVLMCNFTDRRASGQALNTVMPYVDGSCGYQIPAGLQETPEQWNCLSWGDGTVGGVGTNGMLGAIGRAITAAGGSIPSLPDLHQTANNGIQPSQLNPIIPGLPPTIAGISTPLVLAAVVAFFVLRK